MTPASSTGPAQGPLKILFFCAGLEPGRDGVGDYTRLLAGEMTRAGHTCAIIALNDHHVTAPEIAGGPFAVLRLPAAASWTKRARLAKDFRTRFAPDWISFQFVSYGLEPRGNVTALIPLLHEITSEAPLHLMCHELWTGGKGLAHLRHKLAGAVQRRAIKKMIAVLKPGLVTTSNPAYAAFLKGIGTRAALLPLFGNVPVVSPAPSLPDKIASTGLPAGGPERAHWWLGLFFGTIYGEWELAPFLGILRRAARRAGKRVLLVQAGRAGAAGDEIWEKMRRKYRSDFVLLRLGEQPVETLSALLHAADFGIVTSPWHLVGKSGTAAAMLDHGLPVIVPRNDFDPGLPLGDAGAPDPLFHPCDDALEARLRAGLPKRPAHARAGEIAGRLAGLLHAAARPS